MLWPKDRARQERSSRGGMQVAISDDVVMARPPERADLGRDLKEGS